MRIREVYKDYNRFKSQAKKLNKWIRKNFVAEKQYGKICDALLGFLNFSEDRENIEEWLESLNVEEHA